MRYIEDRYGETPTRAATVAALNRCDNNSAPGSRNFGTQVLGASATVIKPVSYNQKSNAFRALGDSLAGRPNATYPELAGPLMGSGAPRAAFTPATQAIQPLPTKWNQSRAKVLAQFAKEYDRFKHPDGLSDIYKSLPPRTLENRIAYAEGSDILASDKFEAAAARAEKNLRLTNDLVLSLGADYQPLLDEAQDILSVISQARSAGAELPPSVAVRSDALEKGISGLAGERVGLTRGVSPDTLLAASTSPAEIRAIVTDVVDAATAGMSTQVADMAAIVATLASSIPAATTALIASATTAVADAGATGGPTAALVAALQVAMDMGGTAPPSARKKAVEDLIPIALRTIEEEYKDTLAMIKRIYANKSASTSAVTNTAYVAIQAEKAADPSSTWKIKDRVAAARQAADDAAKLDYDNTVAGVLAMAATLAA